MMSRPLAVLSVILSVLPAAALAQAPAPSPAPPTFPSDVEMVTVDVVVTDKKGVPVTGLQPSDFELREDGRPQQVGTFEAVVVPPPPPGGAAPAQRPRVSTNTEPEDRHARTFVLMFDDIHLTNAQAHRARTAMAAFLKSGLREGDRVSLVSTAGSAWWSTRMTAGRDELVEMLKRLEGRHVPEVGPDRMSEWEAMRIHAFHDQQVQERVRRRFEQFGLANRQQTERTAIEEDPLVRGRATDVYFQAVRKNRLTLMVMDRVLTSLAATRGRKALILVSEGFIYDPNLDEFKRVVQASRRSNTAVYFLDTRGLSGMSSSFSAEFGPAPPEQDVGAYMSEHFEAAEGADNLAADSGGFTVRNTNDLTAGLNRIAEESRSYYLIGYAPTDTRRDGRFRKIQVKVAGRKGLQVRARRGYYAPLEGGQSAADEKTKSEGNDPDIQAALDSPYELPAIPMRMSSFVFDETLLGKAATFVATEIDVRALAFREEEGRSVDTLEFLLVVAHRESGEFYRYDQKIDMRLSPQTKEKLFQAWMPIVRDFELAPGGYQAKMVVRDANSRRLGTLVHEFEVPKLDSQLRASSPIVSDTLQQDDEKATPRPSMIVRRSFAPDATLYLQFEVYGAQKEKATGMPKVTAGYNIRRKGGDVVRRYDATPIRPTSLGKLSRIVGSPLEGLEPGDYEVVLGLRDELAEKTVEIVEPFSVVPARAAAAAPAVTPAP